MAAFIKRSMFVFVKLVNLCAKICAVFEMLHFSCFIVNNYRMENGIHMKKYILLNDYHLQTKKHYIYKRTIGHLPI